MREYPENLTSGEIDKIKFSNIERKKSNSKCQKGIPLVVTYHPLLKSLSSILFITHVSRS